MLLLLLLSLSCYCLVVVVVMLILLLFVQNDSGIAGRRHRCLEQVVLFAKALNLLDSLFTSYGMEMAMGANEEPPEQMKKGTGSVCVWPIRCVGLTLFWTLSC